MCAPETSLVFTCHPLLRRLLLYNPQSLDRFRYLWPTSHGFAIPPKLQGAQEHFQNGQHLCPRSPILAPPPPILWHEHRAIHHLRHINPHFPASVTSQWLFQGPPAESKFLQPSKSGPPAGVKSSPPVPARWPSSPIRTATRWKSSKTEVASGNSDDFRLGESNWQMYLSIMPWNHDAIADFPTAPRHGMIGRPDGAPVHNHPPHAGLIPEPEP